MSFSSYYKNFILCGDLDHHCLLCDETFNDRDDSNKHVRWENHRKKLKTLSALPQFKNDGIYKVKNYFYCTHCNHVAFNMLSIKAHVTSSSHALSKSTPNGHPHNTNIDLEVKYDDSDNVLINEMKISTNSWNGIINKKCLLCNVCVTNIEKHVVAQEHVVRLIQSETKYEGSLKCYRKINDTTIQCFKCIKTFSPEDYEEHWKQYAVNKYATPKKVSWEEYKEISSRYINLEELADIPDEYFKVDLKNNLLICNICNLVVKHTKEDILEHSFNKHKILKSSSKLCNRISEAFNNSYILVMEETDYGKKKHELAVFGKENHIKLDAGGKRGYCTLCDRFLCLELAIFKEHVDGLIHTRHLEYKGLIKPKKQKQKQMIIAEIFPRYIMTISYIPDIDYVCMNHSLGIDSRSLLFLKRIKHGKHFRITRCLVCEENFKWFKEKEHCESSAHKAYVLGAKILLQPMSFVREVKPKLFHCGACNILLPFCDALNKHIVSRVHNSNTLSIDYKNTIQSYVREHVQWHELIEHSKVNDVFYSNIMNVLFKSYISYPMYFMESDKDRSVAKNVKNSTK